MSPGAALSAVTSVGVLSSSRLGGAGDCEELGWVRGARGGLSAPCPPQTSSLAQEGEELSGQARCPFDAKQSIVALFAGGCWIVWGDTIPTVGPGLTPVSPPADGSLYSATVADFQASDAVIYRSLSAGRPPLRSLKYSSRWLQGTGGPLGPPGLGSGGTGLWEVGDTQGWGAGGGGGDRG